jgi:hypothetical protein
MVLAGSLSTGCSNSSDAFIDRRDAMLRSYEGVRVKKSVTPVMIAQSNEA